MRYMAAGGLRRHTLVLPACRPEALAGTPRERLLALSADPESPSARPVIQLLPQQNRSLALFKVTAPIADTLRYPQVMN